MAPGRINQTRMQSPKAGQKSGWLSTIRGRLYLAFGFAASLTIIGSSIAFYEFTVIGLTTNEIAFRSLPTTTVSLRLAEQTTSLVSSGPRLAAGTDAIRAEIIENIGKQEKNLEDGIAHLKKLGIAKADDIEASRKTLADRLQTLNEAVSHRIIMSTERAYLASSVRAAHEALLIGLAPAIDDANFDLMMGARQEGAAALDARLEYLRRLLETESESNLLAGLLTEASLVNDASRLEHCATGRAKRSNSSFCCPRPEPAESVAVIAPCGRSWCTIQPQGRKATTRTALSMPCALQISRSTMCRPRRIASKTR
jgi:phosphoglycerate-specific signal transduction histidine kinase